MNGCNNRKIQNKVKRSDIIMPKRKIDPVQWEFQNEEFIRGQWLITIIANLEGQGYVPLTDSERQDFEKQISKLEQEKALLQTEVEKHKRENQGYEYQLSSLQQTLQNIDHRQRQLMVTLAQLLQEPRYMENSESQNKKRSSSPPLLNLEQIEKLDSSITFWEKFLSELDQNPSLPSRAITEMAASSRDLDLNVSPCSLDGPAISSICIDLESRQKPSGIDVNMSPTKIFDSEKPKDSEVGANDVSWQQFLT
ncbi:hypothetical protein CDL12_28601 [Handroanthus impetiginosus]|uniref:Uncharacterized protein n=1 Tax=Handroanthus impetiginosus TaxID=429701 RepID=A0A2G9G136_9LAMI|nr:hypothetical protein CDL12_28601 [Handroanthus impetiginosus]